MRVINRLANATENSSNHFTLVVIGEGDDIVKKNLVDIIIEDNESPPPAITVDGDQLIKAIQNAMNR